MGCSVVIVMTSSKKERLIKYLVVEDITLTKENVRAIDESGIKGRMNCGGRGRISL